MPGKLFLPEYELRKVPIAAQVSAMGLLFIALSFCITPSAFLAPSSMAVTTPLWFIFLSFLIGGTIAVFMLAPSTAAQCAKYGISTHMFIKAFWGSAGWYVPDIGLVIIRAGWSAFVVGLIALLFSHITGITYWVSCVIFGAGTLLACIFGIQGIKWFSYIAVPIMFIVFIAAFFPWNNIMPFSEAWSAYPVGKTFADVPMWTILSGGAAFFAAGIVPAGDWFRYSANIKTVYWVLFVAVVPLTLLTTTLGGFGGRVAGTWDITQSLMLIGWGVPALIALVLAGMTTNASQLYSAALGATTLHGKERIRLWIIIMSILVTVVAALGVVQYIVPWLKILGAIIAPIAGVPAGEFFILRRSFESKRRMFGGVYIPALFAFIGGALVGIFVPVGIVLVNAFVAAMLLHVAAVKIQECFVGKVEETTA